MLKRPIALLLLFVTVPQLGGCAMYHTSGVRPADLTPEERGAPGEPRLVSVLFSDGGRMDVDSEPPAYQSHDTIYAWSGGAAHLVPTGAVGSLVLAFSNGVPLTFQVGDLTRAADAALGPHVGAYQPWDGAEVRFDRGRATWIAGDTLHGVVGGAPRTVTTGSIRSVSVVRTLAVPESVFPAVLLVLPLAAFVVYMFTKCPSFVCIGGGRL